MKRVAVVLFNLGGPDGQADVKPFLFNLFNDPAIISLPGLLRTPLARLISSRREKAAQANYAIMGGGSPLLPETEKQAAALEQAVANILSSFADRPHVFNLGHGILPDTPIAHVERLLELVRGSGEGV